MTGGASVEEMLSLMVVGLHVVKGKLNSPLDQVRVALSAGYYLESLLGNLPCKTGWQRAETAGDEGPWRQWNADSLRDMVHDHVQETLVAAVLDVSIQGRLARARMCLQPMFLRRVMLYVYRPLYHPKAWTSIHHVCLQPLSFATKPSLVCQMIARSLRARMGCCR